MKGSKDLVSSVRISINLSSRGSTVEEMGALSSVERMRPLSTVEGMGAPAL